MIAKRETLIALLAFASSMTAMAQSQNDDPSALRPQQQGTKQGISILELDEVVTPATPLSKATQASTVIKRSTPVTSAPAKAVPAALTSVAMLDEHNADGTEVVRQRFPNGSLQIERSVTEDAEGNIVNHGSYTEYNAKAEVIASGNYEYGKREGTWTKQITLEQTKQLTNALDGAFTAPFTSQAEFKQGKLQGEWIVTDSKGNIVLTWSMENDQRHGTSVVFDVKGSIVQSITYDHNIAHGPAKITLGKSKAPESLELIRGMVARSVDKYFPSKSGDKGPQKLQSQEWQLLPTDLNIATQDWERNVVEVKPMTASAAVRHGMAVTFYSNGQRESEGYYENGKKNGTFAWWYPNGQQKTVGEYRNDLEDAEWLWWHENGMKQATGKYADGKKVNEWSVWNADGALVKRQVAENSRVAERGSDDVKANVKR